MKNKNSKKITGLFLSIFIILAGFLFFGINNAHAEEALGTCTFEMDGKETKGAAMKKVTCESSPFKGTWVDDNPTADTGGTCSVKNKSNGKTGVTTVANEAECIALEGTYNKGATYEETTAAMTLAKKKELTNDDCSVGEVFNGSCALVGILEFNGMILAASAALFGVVVDADKLQLVVDNDGLYTVWMEVRDFLNIAFILFLLYSAFSIIFQIGGKFGEKKIILTIVLMALLVNFSFPIARFIVDVSNSLMYTMLAQFFPTANSDNILTGITTGGDIKKILKTNSHASYPQLFAAIFFTFILAMTFLALAALFLVRIVALAILIIVSPIAFVGNIAGKDFGWWDNMIKYAFFGPIMVFVLHIAIFTMSAIGESFKLADQDSVITSMANMAIPIVILWMGMGIAQKMGIEGAGAVMGLAQKASGWLPRKIASGAKSGTMAGLKAIDRNTLAKWNVSPRQFMKAWTQSTEEAETDKLAEGTGVWHDKINSFFSRQLKDPFGPGSLKTNYADLARQQMVTKKTKDLKEISEEAPYLLDQLSASMDSKSPEAVAKMKAIFRIIYNNNDQDELMGYINKNIADKTPLGAKFEKMEFTADNSTVSGTNVSEAVIRFMNNSKVDSDQINKELLDLGNIAATKGGIGYGAVEYNKKTKQFERVAGEDDKQGKQGWAVASKMMTTGEAQNIPKTMHRNHFTDEGPNGGKLNEEGKALLLKYASPTAIKHIERHKPDFYKALCVDDGGKISNQMLQYAAELKAGTAYGWDPDIEVTHADGTTTKGKYDKLKINPKQAINAAAWTAALQLKAGQTVNQVKDNLGKNNFTVSEIDNIMKLVKNENIEGEPIAADPNKHPGGAGKYF